MIAYDGESHILQPVFMEGTGTMSIMELWSEKDKKKYLNLMDKNSKVVMLSPN